MNLKRTNFPTSHEQNRLGADHYIFRHVRYRALTLGFWHMTNERRGLPSASSFRRFELCAGSWQLEQEAERLGQSAHVTSPEAESGIRIHAWLAGEKVELSDTEGITAQFLNARGLEQIERIFQGEECNQVREKRLWLKVNGKEALSGRFDVVTYTPKLALVQDFKTGFSEPDPAEQNAQMLVLAVLVALSLPEVEEVIVQIVSGPYGVTESRYDLAALGKAYNHILDVLEALNAPDAPLNPSTEACKFCPAVLICQALKDTVVRPLTKLQISALPESGPQAAKLLDEVEVMTGLLKEIKKFYAEKFEDPTYEIPGYRMMPGATVREVTDWHAARQRLEEFIDEKDLAASETYSLADIEKALGRKLKLKAKEAKVKLNEILAGLIEERQNQPSLKRVRGETKSVALTNAIE
jgi:Protein of unknown function (DUF2800)